MKKLLLLLLIANGSANAGVEFLYSAMFSFGGSATANSGIIIDHSGEMEIEPTGNTWSGVGPDGQTRTISTMRYRFPGTITATFPSSCYKSSGASWAMAGWGVYQPSVTTSFTQSQGALYSSPGSPQSAGSYYKLNWDTGGAVPQGYQFTFRGQNLSGYVYVTTGPSGIYNPVGSGSSKPTYVHSSQDTPNARPYLQVDYSQCGTIFRLGDPPLPSPPIIDPTETVTCNFSTDGNIDLGTVDTTTALGTQGSTKLYTQCNGDTSVTATIGKSTDRNTNIITRGGLTIPVYFSDSVGESKTLTYPAGETLISHNVTAKVTAADTVIPGEYTESMIITLNYE